MTIYSDFDIARSLVDCRSTTEFYTSNIVIWLHEGVKNKCSLQAEFRVPSTSIDEVQWIRILSDLKIPYEEPIKVFCDNKSAVRIAHDLFYHDKTKHVDID